jgi:UDPglucose 6-dehydrogenase
LIVVTEWNEFKNVDLLRLREELRRPVVIDGRNIYDPERMDALGFIYRGIGRGHGGTGISQKELDQSSEGESPSHAASAPEPQAEAVDVEETSIEEIEGAEEAQ